MASRLVDNAGFTQPMGVTRNEDRVRSAFVGHQRTARQLRDLSSINVRTQKVENQVWPSESTLSILGKPVRWPRVIAPDCLWYLARG